MRSTGKPKAFPGGYFGWNPRIVLAGGLAQAQASPQTK